jgi:hypothetical protein
LPAIIQLVENILGCHVGNAIVVLLIPHLHSNQSVDGFLGSGL